MQEFDAVHAMLSRLVPFEPDGIAAVFNDHDEPFQTSLIGTVTFDVFV